MRLLSLLLLTLFAGATGLAPGGFAQVGSAKPADKSGTRLFTLGTKSGPAPGVGRAQSSNLLIINGALYVVDAGDGITRRLTRLKTNFRDIDNIFITHPHSDHTSGLGGLLSVQYDLLRTKLVNIYGPPGTKAGVDGLVQYLTVSSEIRISDGTRTAQVAKVFRGQDVAPGIIFQDANVKVTAVENTHFNFPPGSPGYGKYKSYAYRFDAADRSIVFTGDTGPSDAVTNLARGADILVSEIGVVEEQKESQIRNGRWQAMTPSEQAEFLRHQEQEHLSPEEVGQMAKRAGVKTVVLTHLGPTTGSSDYAPWIDRVKKQFSGHVLVAQDLMEF
jgi:ribonuclease BN (tRNA processing enzyme)